MTETRCRAKDKSTCRVHGHAHTSNAWFSVENLHKSYVESKKTADSKPVDIKNVSHRALASSLVWDGEKPVWWEEFKAAAMADEILPTTPELIDVIDSPAGPLAVVWQHESQDSRDRGPTMDSGMGVNICYYKSMETGEVLGYVKMTYMDDATVERSFGDDEFMPFRWQSRYSGTHYDFEDEPSGAYGDRNLEGDALLEKRRTIWWQVQRSMGSGVETGNGNYVAPYNVSVKHVPDDATVLKDLKKFSSRIKKDIKNKRAFYATPYVDFARVEEPLIGKGFGTALYVYTARKLAEQGKVLRASSLQTPDAQAAWANFSKRFPDNVSSIDLDYGGQKSVSPVLDFRQ